MTDREAQDIIRMIESNWQMDLGTARSLWRAELVPHDAELATRAVTYLARKLTYKPKLADLTQVLTMFSRNRKIDDRAQADARAIEQGKRGYATPEWVWVWKWARNSRSPLEWRGFPQQGDWTNPQTMMSMSEYEALRGEWLDAGSPKEKGNVIAVQAV